MPKVTTPKPDCIIAKGSARTDGYGWASYQGSQQLAHRVAWQKAFGPIPEGMLVCHTCDVRDCVNPAHLFLGTHKSNYDDSVAKTRRMFDPINMRFAKWDDDYA